MINQLLLMGLSTSSLSQQRNFSFWHPELINSTFAYCLGYFAIVALGTRSMREVISARYRLSMTFGMDSTSMVIKDVGHNTTDSGHDKRNAC
jgi:hypothetical protein